MEKEKSKSGWYPGKYYNSFVRSRKEKKAVEGLSRDFDSDSENVDTSDIVTAANTLGGDQESDDYQVVGGNEIISGKSTKIKANFLPSILPIGSTSNSKSESNVGKIRLILSNYQSMGMTDVTSPVIYVEIEGVHKVFKNINNASNIVTNFYFNDIISDIYILLIDESDGLIKGRIITSISSYMTLKGPKEDATEWKIFLPLNDTGSGSAVSSSSIATYQSCHYEHVNGMIKTREIFPILNITTSIELLIPSPVMLYLIYPVTDVSEIKNNADPNTYERDIQRVINIVQTPPIFIPFLTFPEGFVLVGLVSLVVFGVSTCYIPFVVYGMVILNGMIARPSYSYVTQYMPTRDKTANKIPIISHQYVSLNLNRLRGIVRILEKVQNITCFVDMNMSLIFYTVFLGLAMCTSIFLMIFSVKFVIFIGLMVCFLVLVVTNSPSSSHIDSNIQKYALGYIVYRRLHAFWCRIPTSVSAEHRYITSLQCINPRKGVYKEHFKDPTSTPDSITPVGEKSPTDTTTTTTTTTDNNADSM